MQEETWFRRGDVVRFTDAGRGFHLEAARVCNALPGQQLLVETVDGRMELVIAESQVIAWECA